MAASSDDLGLALRALGSADTPHAVRCFGFFVSCVSVCVLSCYNTKYAIRRDKAPCTVKPYTVRAGHG